MREVIVALLSLGSIGLLFGIILSFLDSKLKVKEDPQVEKLLGVLPGLNCGACGFAGCDAFAKAVVKNKDLFNGCRPAGVEINQRIAGILGLEKRYQTIPLKVAVLCGARFSEKKMSFEYKGPQNCALADISLANIDCRFGCLGFGDCVKVCPTQALHINKGLVIVDYKKCIGCGKCVKICPRDILELVEQDSQLLYAVSCSNLEDAVSTKKVCSHGCIGCGICAKIIKDSCFRLEQGLSRIDYKNLKKKTQDELDLAVNKCPVKIISKFNV